MFSRYPFHVWFSRVIVGGVDEFRKYSSPWSEQVSSFMPYPSSRCSFKFLEFLVAEFLKLFEVGIILNCGFLPGHVLEDCWQTALLAKVEVESHVQQEGYSLLAFMYLYNSMTSSNMGTSSGTGISKSEFAL